VPWPPQLDDLKAEIGRPRNDTADDPQLQIDLDAAVAYVERERFGDFNFAGSALSLLPAPTDVFLGTLRLAFRWWNRRRSPEGVIDLGDVGMVTRVARVDSDVERMLGIGSYRLPMI
jgi:hypothetical protein